MRTVKNGVIRWVVMGVRTGFLLASLLWVTVAVSGGIAAYSFENEEDRVHFQTIIDELRCPKCKNQSVADSDAPIAKDIRDRVYEQVLAGASRDEIVQFMVDRYGQFVTYRPPLSRATFLLWFGPPLLVVFVLIVVFWRRLGARSPVLTQVDSLAVEALLAAYPQSPEGRPDERSNDGPRQERNT